MDAILISWRPGPEEVKDVRQHLADGHEYYWRVRFKFAKENEFKFPMLGYVHMAGREVEHLLTIQDIIPFSPSHYELPNPVIPRLWIDEWNEKPNERIPWKTQLVVTKIEPFRYNTLSLKKCDGTLVKLPPRNFIRVLVPNGATEASDTKSNQVLVHEDKPSRSIARSGSRTTVARALNWDSKRDLSG